jgi:hypothetical protein
MLHYIVLLACVVSTLAQTCETDYRASAHTHIVGSNQEQIPNLGLNGCFAHCCSKDWCKSFDYEPSTGTCWFSVDNSETPVGSFQGNAYLRTGDSPYDLFEKNSMLAAAAATTTPAVPTVAAYTPTPAVPCTSDVSMLHPYLPTYAVNWLCDNSQSMFAKKRKYIDFKNAGYTDVSLFNNFWDWYKSDTTRTFSGYFHSAEFGKYQLKISLREKFHNEAEDDLFQYVDGDHATWKWDTQGLTTADEIHDAFVHTTEYTKAKALQNVLYVAKSIYPGFNEEWNFKNYVDAKYTDVAATAPDIIVTDWRASTEYATFIRQKQIKINLANRGYHGMSLVHYCEGFASVTACIAGPLFQDKVLKENTKSEVKRIGFKNRDEFEAFWTWYHPTLTPSPTRAPTQPPQSSGGAGTLTNHGWSPLHKLELCHGDCDSDSDCVSGLVCFHRHDKTTPIPGCPMTNDQHNEAAMDYCVNP